MRRAGLLLVLSFAACNPSSPRSSDAKQPGSVDEPVDRDDRSAPESTPPPPAPSDAPAAKAQGSCEELEQRWEAEAAKLERACESKDECSLLWSDYVCYALRSQSDDVSVLESIDAGMEGRCSTVECEPPPPIACKSGRCDWDL